jgi:hypothetical protein
LGRGGSGTVYLARQESLGRLVAMKVLTVGDATMAERLLAEARVLAELRDPHLMDVIDFGVADGTPWYTMTYCGGGTLAEIIARDGSLPPAQVAMVGGAVASALGTLHARGIVHRDVKPGNILLTNDGDVVLGDLGTALDARAERVTTTGAVLGTMGYTAPELISGEAPTPASDVFSFGVVLYESLTGERPFRGGHIAAVIDAIRGGRHEPVIHLARSTPPAMSALVEQMLSVDPSQRPRDMQEVAGRVRGAVAPARLRPKPPGGAVAPATMAIASGRDRVVPVQEPEHRRRRRPLAWIAGGAAAALLLSGLTWAAVGRGSGDPPAEAADGTTTTFDGSGTTVAPAAAGAGDSTAVPDTAPPDNAAVETTDPAVDPTAPGETLAPEPAPTDPGVDVTSPPVGPVRPPPPEVRPQAEPTPVIRPQPGPVSPTPAPAVPTPAPPAPTPTPAPKPPVVATPTPAPANPTPAPATPTPAPATPTPAPQPDVCPHGDHSGNAFDKSCGVDPCPYGDNSGASYDGSCGVDPCPNGVDASGNTYDGQCGNAAPVANGESMGFTFKTNDPSTTQKCNSNVNVRANDYDPQGQAITVRPTGTNGWGNNAPNGTYYTMSSNGAFTICATRGARDTRTALVVYYVVEDGTHSVATQVTISLTLT